MNRPATIFRIVIPFLAALSLSCRRRSLADGSHEPPVLASFPQHGQFVDRPDLDAPQARQRHPRGQPDRLVEVPGLEDGESAQVFPSRGARTVGDRDLAAADSAGRDRVFGVEGVRGDDVAAPAEFIVVSEARLDEGRMLVPCQGVERPLVAVDQAQVSHRVLHVPLEGSPTP
jgi:hypothetical protein